MSTNLGRPFSTAEANVLGAYEILSSGTGFGEIKLFCVGDNPLPNGPFYILYPLLPDKKTINWSFIAYPLTKFIKKFFATNEGEKFMYGRCKMRRLTAQETINLLPVKE